MRDNEYGRKYNKEIYPNIKVYDLVNVNEKIDFDENYFEW